ncbi:aldose epimerase family protein [Pseudomonas sp. CT11-2]|uniref:aldose epimerase family protein n=1 Tax=Pseudomonas sp. CT11-2 TaxID=3243023 RepID=UPI0039AFBEBE
MPEIEIFDHLPTGEAIQRHWLKRGKLRVAVLSYGATLQDLRLEGVGHSLVLGATNIEPYQGVMEYFGATVGRVANRIAQGRATINGNSYQLDQNNLGKHLLHGGSDGCHKKIWCITEADHEHVTLRLSMADGHMGFPGAIDACLTYRIVGSDTLELDVEVCSDANTLCNFAHHSYYNLDGSENILDHELQVSAKHYLPVDGELIPTGEIAVVRETRFDFNTIRPIRNGAPHLGYDQNLCLSRAPQTVRRVASLRSPKSGVTMHLETTAPGLQIYDGQHIETGSAKTLSDTAYGSFAGIALEPQDWPDAVHHPGFPTTLLERGGVYRQKNRWIFEQPTILKQCSERTRT